MREFVVTLRFGKRYTVRAERLALLDGHTLALVVGPATADGSVAVFDRGLVVSVVAADHLVAEADDPAVVAAGSDIPF